MRDSLARARLRRSGRRRAVPPGPPERLPFGLGRAPSLHGGEQEFHPEERGELRASREAGFPIDRRAIVLERRVRDRRRPSSGWRSAVRTGRTSPVFGSRSDNSGLCQAGTWGGRPRSGRAIPSHQNPERNRRLIFEPRRGKNGRGLATNRHTPVNRDEFAGGGVGIAYRVRRARDADDHPKR